MRYLTFEWATGGLSDQEWESRWIAYQEHQEAVLARLAAGAQSLVRDLNLHGAVLKHGKIDEGTIVLRLVAGDLQRGYEFVDIVYLDAQMSEPASDCTYDWPADPRAEVIWDEVDVVGDCFAHRFLLHNGGEFEVRFCEAEVRRLPAQPSDR